MEGAGLLRNLQEFPMALSQESKKILRQIAWDSIKNSKTDPTFVWNDEISVKGASFVTLKKQDHLRGCMGTILAEHKLALDVIQNARNAAFRDPRFEPVEHREIPDLDLSISVLSPMEKLKIASEEELIKALRPEIDGLYLLSGSRRATFLPSVWEQIPDPEQYLSKLKQKAGIAGRMDDFSAYRYTTEHF